MEDRVDRLENLMEASARLHEIILHNQAIMQENYRSIEENNRRIDENNRRIDEGLEEAWALMQQLSQAVTVLQAEVVRIDQTHG